WIRNPAEASSSPQPQQPAPATSNQQPNDSLEPAVKALMRKILVAAAFVAFAAPAFGASLFDETEKISRTVAFEPGGTLRVKTFSGRVTITASDKNEVAVEAVRHASRDRLDRIKLDIHREGSTLVIDTNHRENSCWD